MDRQKFEKKIKNKGIGWLVLAIIFLPAALMTVVRSYVANGFSLLFLVGALFGIIAFGIVGVIGLINALDYFKGFGSKYAKIMNLEALYDELNTTPVYKNDYLLVTEKAIADCESWDKVAAREDVLCVYEYIMRRNGFITSRSMRILLRNGRMLEIFVPKDVTDQEKEQIFKPIYMYCPNAKLGYNSENLKYVKAQRKAYKQAQKAAK